MKPGLLYRFLKVYVPLGFRIYYRRFQIHNQDKVPLKGPVIFAINHQNAFMDALIVAVSSARNPWFITRASVFGSATARWWLQKLQMLPIYRFRDGHANMKKNDEAMERTRQLLLQNQTILIFPEGNHDRHWSLRPLQKGIARMSFDLEQTSSFTTGLQIVPVGIQYENHLLSRSEVLITFGDPITLTAYRELYENQPAHAVNALMADLKTAMQKLIVDIPVDENYTAYHNAVQQRQGRAKELFQRLTSDKEFISGLLESKQLPAIKSRRQPGWCSWLKPLFLLVFLPHFPALFLIQLLIKKVVKDDHWTSSIKFAGLIILFPLLYLIEIVLFWVLTQNLTATSLFVLALIPTGIAGLNYRDCCRKSAVFNETQPH